MNRNNEKYNFKNDALYYANLGFSVFPLWKKSKNPITKNGLYDATTDEKQINYWWGRYPEDNIGIATGKVSGNIIVVDLDIDKNKDINGYHTLLKWEREHGKLPETAMSITGRGGYHLFFRTDGRSIQNSVDLYEGIDIRADGGYIVAPPSIHPNGNKYEWEYSPEDTPIADANELVYLFLQGKKKLEVESKKNFKVPDAIPQGQRVGTLFKLTSSLQAKGLSDDAIRAAVIEENNIRCIPPLMDAELDKEVFPALKRYEKGVLPIKKQTSGESTPNLDIGQDVGFDYTLFHFYDNNKKVTGINHNAIAEDIKTKHSLFVSGCFYERDKGYYKPDVTGAKIKGYIKQRIMPDLRKSQVINQIYNLLHDDFSIERNFNDTNLYPARWVPFNDCLLDPLTFEEIAYSDDFYCVNRLPHNWKDCKNATKGEETEKYLHFSIPDEQDREMSLEYDGLSCNRDTSFQKAMLVTGGGGTGKSVKLRVLQSILGAENYSNVGLFDLSKRFMPGQLLGKLANICSDLPIKAMSDEANEALKLIVGEDTIFHETKGQNGFFFTPYCKMTFSTNMLPQVLDERNNAVFRRLLILRMDNTPEHPDINLFYKLEKELPYYIKLTMEALHRVYENGFIAESENSKNEIEQMRKDSDVTESWICDCCEVGMNLKMERTDAFNSFQKYCESEERTSLTKNGFFKALRNKNFIESKSGANRYFIGLGGKICPNNDKFLSISNEELAEILFT